MLNKLKSRPVLENELMNWFRWKNHSICRIVFDNDWRGQIFLKLRQFLKYFNFSKKKIIFFSSGKIYQLPQFLSQVKKINILGNFSSIQKTSRDHIFDFSPQTSVKNDQTLLANLPIKWQRDPEKIKFL